MATSSSSAPSGTRVIPCNRLLLAVLAVTAAAYLWTLHFSFVYDDLGQIVANPLVQSWHYLPMYFHGNVWMQQSSLGNYYRPLFLLWLLLNHTFFGLHPAWWHFTTVLAHLGATALVYLLALRLTRDQKIAVIAALIFGVHPVHVESVAWISGVTDPLLALLIIPAFLAFLNYRESKGARWLAASVGLYAMALLAKETAVVLPVLLIAYVLLYPEEPWKAKFTAAAKVLVPFAVVTAAYLAVRASALHTLAHRTVNLPASISLFTMPSVLWFYIRQLVAPVHLSAFYDTPYVTHVSWKFFLAPLTGVIITLAVLALGWWKSRSPLVPLAAAWLFLPLLPLLNLSLLPMGDFIHDRYLYLPSIGFALLVAFGLAKLDTQKLAGLPAGAMAGGLIVGAMLAGTVAQSLPWADDISLYAHGIQVAPLNDLPRNKLAATYVGRGMYEQGIQAYRYVLANDPDFWYANFRMGYAQYMTGHYEQAQQYLAKAIKENPTPDELYYLGLASLKLKQYAVAESALRQAWKQNPQAPGYAFALGTAMKEEGKLQPALEMFRAELALRPTDASTQAEIEEITAMLARECSAPGAQCPAPATAQR